MNTEKIELKLWQAIRSDFIYQISLQLFCDRFLYVKNLLIHKFSGQFQNKIPLAIK